MSTDPVPTGLPDAVADQGTEPAPDQERPGKRLLVFLHGAGQTPTVWMSQVAVFGSEQPMVAPWLPGAKPGDKQPFDLDRAAQQLGGLALSHGAATLAVVAHQVGCSVAVRLAAQAPELVTSLVLCTPQAAPPRWALKLQRAALGAVPSSRWSDSGWTRDDARGVLDELARADLAGDQSRVRTPTLVVCGADDRPGLAAARLSASQLPGARLATVPGTVTVPAADPDPLNRLLREHLREG